MKTISLFGEGLNLTTTSENGVFVCVSIRDTHGNVLVEIEKLDSNNCVVKVMDEIKIDIT